MALKQSDVHVWIQPDRQGNQYNMAPSLLELVDTAFDSPVTANTYADGELTLSELHCLLADGTFNLDFDSRTSIDILMYVKTDTTRMASADMFLSMDTGVVNRFYVGAGTLGRVFAFAPGGYSIDTLHTTENANATLLPGSDDDKVYCVKVRMTADTLTVALFNEDDSEDDIDDSRASIGGSSIFSSGYTANNLRINGRYEATNNLGSFELLRAVVVLDREVTDAEAHGIMNGGAPLNWEDLQCSDDRPVAPSARTRGWELSSWGPVVRGSGSANKHVYMLPGDSYMGYGSVNSTNDSFSGGFGPALLDALSYAEGGLQGMGTQGFFNTSGLWTIGNNVTYTPHLPFTTVERDSGWAFAAHSSLPEAYTADPGGNVRAVYCVASADVGVYYDPTQEDPEGFTDEGNRDPWEQWSTFEITKVHLHFWQEPSGSGTTTVLYWDGSAWQTTGDSQGVGTSNAYLYQSADGLPSGALGFGVRAAGATRKVLGHWGASGAQGFRVGFFGVGGMPIYETLNDGAGGLLEEGTFGTMHAEMAANIVANDDVDMLVAPTAWRNSITDGMSPSLFYHVYRIYLETVTDANPSVPVAHLLPFKANYADPAGDAVFDRLIDIISGYAMANGHDIWDLNDSMDTYAEDATLYPDGTHVGPTGQAAMALAFKTNLVDPYPSGVHYMGRQPAISKVKLGR